MLMLAMVVSTKLDHDVMVAITEVTPKQYALRTMAPKVSALLKFSRIKYGGDSTSKETFRGNWAIARMQSAGSCLWPLTFSMRLLSATKISAIPACVQDARMRSNTSS